MPRVWIDLATAPQVLFARPIWQALARDGYECLVTVREFGRTAELARQLNIPHVVVGRHGGRGTWDKGVAIARRAGGLARIARQFRPDLAFSHNSYSQALTAAALRIPFVTAMDFEHQPANHLAFRVAKLVLVPEAFPEEALRKYGAAPRRVTRYPGVKEEVYLSDFKPDPDLPRVLDLPSDRVIVTMRPPARNALYHRFENPLFEQLLTCVAETPDAYVVLVDRSSDDSRQDGSVHVLPGAVDGPSLLWWSDVFIGAGGTMTREAAALGTPSYSVFAGPHMAVDDDLIGRGRMKRVQSLADIGSGIVRRKARTDHAARPDGLNVILDVLRAALAGSIG